MKKNYWARSWPHLLLWSHVLGIVGFYTAMWLRTAPGMHDRVRPVPAASQEPAPATPTDPLVSIIVPARNEERNIRRCVESLLAQDYSNYEVIVVDDGSTDHTAAILDDIARSHPHGERLYVLQLQDLPAGWAGKTHAIHKGTREASGEWLLFTDADTWHTANALRTTLTQARAEQADMFTLGSTQELPDFWGRVLMPMAYLGISMLYPPHLVNDPHSKIAIANGQYILIRSAVYHKLGGYARPELRATLLDDRDLAQVVKDHGYRLRFVDGDGLVHVHMYHGLHEIWRGWRKNVYLGNRGGLAFFTLQLFGLPMISIVPFFLPLLTFFTNKLHFGHIRRGEVNTATALEMTALLSYRNWLNKHMHVPWYYSLLHPLAGAIFEGILLQSCWRILTRSGVDWRGRAYHNDRKKA